MNRRLASLAAAPFLVLVAAFPSAAHAQTKQARASSKPRATRSRADSAYLRYAQAIIRADSAVQLAIKVNRSVVTNESAGFIQLAQQPQSTAYKEKAIEVAAAYGAASTILTRRTDDLDAIVPPPDLARVHEQLLKPMRGAADALDLLYRSFRRSTCATEEDLGQACDQGARLVVLGQALNVGANAVEADGEQYRLARQRAEEILRQHGAPIPPYSSDSSSTR